MLNNLSFLLCIFTVFRMYRKTFYLFPAWHILSTPCGYGNTSSRSDWLTDVFGLAVGIIILIRGHLARVLVAADCFRRNSQAPLASWQSQDPDAVPTASRGYTSATGLLWSLLFFENQLEWELFLSPWCFHFVSLRAIVKAGFSTVVALLTFWARSFFVGVGAVLCLAGGLAANLVSYLFWFCSLPQTTSSGPGSMYHSSSVPKPAKLSPLLHHLQKGLSGQRRRWHDEEDGRR